MNTNATIEQLFEHATEDLGTLLWALRAWPTDDGRCSISYVALRLFSSVSRVRSAHEALNKIASADYSSEKSKFDKVFNKTMAEYEQFLSAEKALIENVLNDEGGLSARLRETEASLVTVRKIVQDGMLYDNPELFNEEFNEVASSFLTGFNDFARLLDAMSPVFKDCAGLGLLQGRFIAVETLIRQWHGVFHAAQNLLSAEHEREYNVDFWWLHESPPVYDMTQEMLISDADLPAIGRLLNKFKGTSESCPDEAMLDAYALERGVPESAVVERHLSVCRYCQEHIAARKESEAIRMGQQPIRPFLAKLFKSSAELQAPGLDYASEEDMIEALRKIPAQIVSSDGSVRDGGKVISLAARRPKEKQPEKADFLGCLQELRPDPQALPKAADSGSVDITWGKSVKIKNNIIVNIAFFPALIRQKTFTDTHLLVVGTLTLPSRSASGEKWYCEWVNGDGGIVPVDNFEVKNSMFKAAFARSAVREDGDFRLLLACES